MAQLKSLMILNLLLSGGVQYHGGTQIKKIYSPIVLNTPHGTHDIPHVQHDIPHGTEYLPQYSR